MALQQRTLRELRGRGNPQIEDFLTERGITFDLLQQVSIANIDVETSLHNQARLGQPLNEETVRRYREALKRGTKFPPALVKRQRDGSLMVLDGNHRVAAYAAEELPIDVYECEGRPEALTLVMYEANTQHGLPTSEEDRVAAAMYLIDQGFGMKEAADRMLVSVALVRREVARVNAERRAARVQLDPRQWGRLPDSIRTKLLQLSTDEVFDAAARLVCDTDMKTDQVLKMVTTLNRETSSQTQMDMLAALREEMAPQIRDAVVDGGRGKHGLRSPKARVNMIAAQVRGVGDVTQAVASIAMPERETVADTIEETITRLNELLGALRA